LPFISETAEPPELERRAECISQPQNVAEGEVAMSPKGSEKADIFLERIVPIFASALMAATIAAMKRLFGF
jgi:hypothetical protein